jgi:short subunit dehydrogenase-like uncharacterized protein
MKNKILVYGAGGYMGKLFTRYALARNLPLVLGANKSFESTCELRIFSLSDPRTILDNIHDIKLIINLAGPFNNTNKQFVEACIAAKCHYIDIAGEVPEFESIYAYGKKAEEAGIMIMPGAGFGVVPTDIVANLAKQKLPDCTQLDIAYVTIGGASRGTLKTVLKDIHKEGVILQNGKYQKALPASKTITIEVQGKKYKLVYNPWRADLFTAHLSTGVQNISTYANFPGFVVSMMNGKLLWLRDLILKRLINFIPVGPSDTQLQKGKTICHAIATNNKGKQTTATIIGPEAYLFTTQTLMEIATNILHDHFTPGFQTPAIYGTNILKNIHPITIL